MLPMLHNDSEGAMDYETYRHNREHGIRRDTLAGRIGRDQEEAFNGRYFADCMAWLRSPELTEQLRRIRVMGDS